MILAALLLAAAPAPRPSVARRPAAPAARVADWTRVVTATDKGFLMGNPKAKVKLVEYGSLTCPHCRQFEIDSSAPLATYVHGGKVSYEFRSFLLNGVDVPATLAASCGGPAKFFPMLHALYAAQAQWVAKIQGLPASRMTAIEAMQPGDQFVAIGAAADFASIGAAHGIPAARMATCLNNAPAAEKLASVTDEAGTTLGVNGTPTFFINGAKVDYSHATSFWSAIDQNLKAALRG